MWSPQALPLSSSPRQARQDALGDPRALELRDGREDMHLQLSGRCSRVDAFLQADEGHAERLELVEQSDEVLEAATEPIQSPADYNIETPPPGIADELVERRASINSTADTPVDELLRDPASSGNVAAELSELVLRLLVERTHAGVDRGTHHSTPDSRNEWYRNPSAGSATITKSNSVTPSSSPACCRRSARARSSPLGVGSPLGWLCAMTNAAAFDKQAALKTSRGWTRDASRVPTETTWTPISLRFVLKCSARTRSTSAPARMAAASLAASRGLQSAQDSRDGHTPKGLSR